MRCIAKHYVREGIVTHIPGEVFETKMDAKTIERLKRIGAIDIIGGSDEKIADTEEAAIEVIEETGNEEMPEVIQEIDVMDGIGAGGSETNVVPKTRRRRR